MSRDQMHILCIIFFFPIWIYRKEDSNSADQQIFKDIICENHIFVKHY